MGAAMMEISKDFAQQHHHQFMTSESGPVSRAMGAAILNVADNVAGTKVRLLYVIKV